MKKRVLIVSLNGISNTGGVERVVYYINKILEKKYEVIIVDRNLLSNVFWGNIIKKVFKKIPGKIEPILASSYVKKHKKNSDIIITNGYNCPFVKSNFLFAHGNTAAFLKAKGKSKLRVESMYEYIAAKKANKIIAVSKLVKSEWNKLYNVKKEKISIINNCVDSNKFFPKNEVYNEVIKILFCGRLEENKGIDQLLNLAELINERKDIELIIATNNEKNSNLFSSYKNVDIKINLNIDELNDFYNSGDILYLPSIYEGFEMVTLEALSVGIPVLGNKVGAIRELDEAKKYGVYIIDESNILSEIEKIAKKFKNVSKRKINHEIIRENFSEKRYEEKLISLLGEIGD